MEVGALAGHVSGAFPSLGLKVPKDTRKPPFQTRAEIERQIAHGASPVRSSGSCGMDSS